MTDKAQPKMKSSAFACIACRKNKRKCDAKRPTCGYCLRREHTCEYSEVKPTIALEDRMERLENLVTQLVDTITSTRPAPLPQYETEAPALPMIPGEDMIDVLPHLDPIVSIPEVNQTEHPNGTSSTLTPRPITGPPKAIPRYHNRSSLYSLPSTSSFTAPIRPHSASISGQTEGSLDVTTDTSLAKDARETREAEVANIFLYTLDLPQAPLSLYIYLLDCYWSWIHPMFSMLHRPAFSRGMSQQESAYFNSFLFHALMAHSTRFCRDHEPMKGYEHLIDIFYGTAHNLLHQQLTNPSCVATGQGLLLLSSLEHTKGNVSGAWLFSGMAFRIVQDLGIHLDSETSGELSEVDLEVRRRFWWSAYVWDKMISVYIGRPPMLQETKMSLPRVTISDSTEEDLWTPTGVTCADVVLRPERAVSCFIMACKAAQVLNETLKLHYVDGKDSEPSAIDEESENLMRESVNLLDEMPSCLRIDHKSTVPTHLSHLSCLVHTIIILAHRPHLHTNFYRHPSIAQRCKASAQAIFDIVETEYAAFGLPKFTVVAYTLWTAVSIFVLQLKNWPNLEERRAVTQKLRQCRSIFRHMTAYHDQLPRSIAVLDARLAELGVDP